MAPFSEKVMDHFLNPRNVGEIEHPDGVGWVGNPVCGDMVSFTISVREGRIVDVGFRTFGCGAAIAVSSMVGEMAKGRTLDEAMRISNEMIAGELDGLPVDKMHCSNLGADALHRAIEDYHRRRRTGKPSPVCPRCGAPAAADLARCPSCGSAVGGNPEDPHSGVERDVSL